ncbi:16S rRNA (cytosine(967)-C(5))-methyltransferase [Aliterella atlantica]|uniref:16S rRNA (cytosine(967)-C(5))-methyltransferase n=1 Tax=Aliterella atlantica CENA595 TaxID=1618023 RepID=A0A0D8ZVR5_9CYAN|nr:16S rRNA (cytosine(967)-C(5))-methyltransferase [Aliterella atlantica]KJH72482.1 16S rRNA methyltransferase [Aliterella atlantica CENA595]
MKDSRQLAFIALYAVHKGAYADVALDRALSNTELNTSDRRLVTELVYGSTRRMRSLDALIDQLATKKAEKQPPNLRAILHLGFYQLRYLNHIPPSAAVNSTVELAKKNGFPGLTGFVNGLLRQYIRLSVAGNDPLKLPEDPVERLGILHSFPNWIVEVWLKEFGFEATEQLCIWFNQTPALDLRINPLLASTEQVETALQSTGITVNRVPHLPQALRLSGSTGAVQNLPGFSAGWWTVQDSSAQLVSHLLAPQPNEVVIDACAAPGGKTTHIAELMQDRGTIWACDRTASRLKKLKANCDRLQLHSIQICVGDSRNFTQFIDTADRVLLDVPCSGLGTLHRHADARWRQTPATIQELTALQSELLAQAAKYVKVGGILVYATCTLHPQENEGIIRPFLANNPHWQIEAPPADSPYVSFATKEGWIKVLPYTQQMDGFFMVRLKKTAN